VFGAPSGYRCKASAPTYVADAGTTPNTIVDAGLPSDVPGRYNGWRVAVGDFDVEIQSHDTATGRLILGSPIAQLAPGVSYKLYATSGGGIWYFDPTTSIWTGQNTPPGNTGPTPPMARIAPAVDFSTADDSFVLFAGYSPAADHRAWRLDVRTKQWTGLPVPLTGTPPHMRELLNSFVYDRRNDVFILFGGVCSNDPVCPSDTLNGNTWAYHLPTNTWVNMNPAVAPKARAQQVMAYDDQHGVVVLYGGLTGAGQIANDTWVYHFPSNSWVEVTPVASPPARYLAQIAYDPEQARTVVFGGAGTNGVRADIWALTLVEGAQPNTPPTVSLTTPAPGSSFIAPASIAVSASAGDSDGSVSKVEFFAGATKIGEATTSPFQVNWTGVPVGSYSLTARATDNLGATTTSTPVVVSVAAPPNAPPSVTLTQPGANSIYTAPATLSLLASASDTDGSIARVEFYAGTTKIGEATTLPFQVNWTGVPVGSYSLTARATDNLGATTTSTPVAISVAPPLVEDPPGVNVALLSNGAVALASTSYSSSHPASAVIDGVRHGKNLGSGGVWADATLSQYPDWVQVSFNGVQTIGRIDVFTLPDNIAAGTDPTPTTTFSLYGITRFDVQYWTGSAWATVPGGAVSANNLVWRTFTFAPVATTSVRVLVHAATSYGLSFITEVQAWSAD
jgi:hypothetical protein